MTKAYKASDHQAKNEAYQQAHAKNTTIDDALPPARSLAGTDLNTIQDAIGNRAVGRLLTQPGGLSSQRSLQRSLVQQYDAFEHAQAGDNAPNAKKIVVQGVELSSGEINALADLYGSPQAIQTADPAELRAVVALVRKQRADPKSVTEKDWDDATNGRYTQLNLKNSVHLGPQNAALIAPQSSTPKGVDNRSTWVSYYKDALELARQASNAPDGSK